MTANSDSVPSWFWKLALAVVAVGILLHWRLDVPFETLFVAIFALIGIAILAFAARCFVFTLGFARRAISADGIVVELEERDDDEGTTCHPRVEFEASDHTKHVFTSDFGTGWRSHHVGDAVRVLYDPDRPQDARISTRLWAGEIVLGLAGATFLIVGLFLLLYLENR